MKEGDQNSKFFPEAAKSRRRTYHIISLLNEGGREVDWNTGMQDTMVNYFRDLFKATETDWDEVVQCVARSVTAEHNVCLLRPVKSTEVKQALFHMHPDKSPAPDGISPGFCQWYWTIVGEDIVNMVHEYCLAGTFQDQLTNTNIVLVPNKQHSVRMTYLRPMSLCNVVYKLYPRLWPTDLRR